MIQNRFARIIVDIWGGEDSQYHLARFIATPDDALIISGRELNAGFLVNLRGENNWQTFKQFDAREAETFQ